MDAPTITAAALRALEDSGLEKLTMRAVADRLGVRVGGLYYHVADKSALLRAMADLLCRRILAADPGDATTGDAPVLALCERVREVLRGHRDGARLFAAAPMNGSVGALELMERLIGLLEADTTNGSANVAADTLMSYVTGFVLQEQLQLAPGVWTGLTRAELVERFPLLMRDPDGDEDRVFRASVEAILRGFGVASRPVTSG